jgi:hypothetical protein
VNVARTTLEQIRDRLRLGDRSGALAIVRALLSSRAQGGALARTDIVRCDHYDCTLPASTCLSRQVALWPGKRARVHAYCGSGECAQGACYARRAMWDPRTSWSRRRFSFYRADSHEQHAARKRQAISGSLPWTEAQELVQIGSAAVSVRPRARRGT